MPAQLSRVASGRLPAWSAAPVPAAQEAADSSHPKTGHWSRMQEQEVGYRNAVRGRFEVSEFCTNSFFFSFNKPKQELLHIQPWATSWGATAEHVVGASWEAVSLGCIAFLRCVL